MRADRALYCLSLAFFLALPATSSAQEGNVVKADKALAAFEAGDAASLSEALVALRAASEHPKTAATADTWARLGHVLSLYASDPSLPGAPEGSAQAMLRAYAGALKIAPAGPAEPHRAVMIADLQAVVGAETAALFNDVEAGAWESAYARIATPLEGRAMLATLGADNASDRTVLLRLAALSCAWTQRFDEAKAHHEAFVAAGEFDPTLTVQVAKRIEAADPAAALAWLSPIAAAHPADSTLLTAEVKMLVGADKAADAVARVDAAAAVLGDGVGPQVTLADLYTTAKDLPKARAAWEKVLARDPNIAEALVPMARFLLEDVAAADAALKAPKPPTGDAKKKLEGERSAALTRALELLTQRKATAPDDKVALELLVRVYEGMGDSEGVARTKEALGG